MEDRNIGSKSARKLHEMPVKHVKFKMKKIISSNQMELLRNGHIPASAEDPWFCYMVENRLYVHRNRSGNCIFILSFDEGSDIIHVTANRDELQYKCTDNSEDARKLRFLLDVWTGSNIKNDPSSLMQMQESGDALVVDDLNVKKEYVVIGNKSVEAVFFHRPEEPNGFLSNLCRSDFVIDGIRFMSAEQYLLFRKCCVFGDMKNAEKIISTEETRLQQKYARLISGYDDIIWTGMRQVILSRALHEKFNNKALREALLKTGDSLLVYSSLSDTVWGSGIALNDPKRTEIRNWTGSNLLGFALMEVRDTIRTAEKEGGEQRVSQMFLNLEDITRLEIECIVNPAEKSLLNGSGADDRIFNAAGPGLLEECKTLNGCDVGEAKLTKGYSLNAKWVIHTVGPLNTGEMHEEALLANCYKNSLDIAKKNGISAIAFPPISTGSYGFSKKDSAKIAIKAVNQWLTENKDYVIDIVFCCSEQEDFDAYKVYFTV